MAADTPYEQYGLPPTELSPEDVKDWAEPPPELSAQDVAEWPSYEDVRPSSPLTSFGRRAAIEAPVGVASALGGVGAGILGGSVAGPPGMIIGGLIGGGVSGFAASTVEDQILDQLGLREGTGFFSRAQEHADKAENPIASFSGELAGNVLPGFGVGKGAMKAARGLGAGIGGGVEAGTEYARGEDMDPLKIGLAAGAQAVFAKPRGWVEGATKGLRPKPGTGFNTVGEPYGPEPPQAPPRGRDVKEDIPLEGEVIPPGKAQRFTGDPNIDRDLKFAYEQRDVFPDSDPMRAYWDEHIENTLAAHEGGYGRPDNTYDATYGPMGETNEFTYRDSDRANDLTTVSRGIAAENPPAPKVPGAGNPTGAPMGGRIAQRPNDPGRDYRKITGPKAESAPGAESKPITQGDVKDDVILALTFGRKGVQGPQAQGQPPSPQAPAPRAAAPLPEPPPPAPEPQLPAVQQGQAPQKFTPDFGQEHELVQRAIQASLRRPIRTTPIPEGMNSSTDIRGPVYADPSIPPELRRFGSIHETVEQMLMAKGIPYAKAHAHAENAERQAVEAAGHNWNEYEHKWSNSLAHTEREKAVAQPGDKHVATDVALDGTKPVTAAVTEHPHKDLIDKARKRGMEKLATALTKQKAISPEQRALVEQGLAKGEKAEYDQGYRGKVEGLGVQHGGGKREVRKNAANRAVQRGVLEGTQNWDPDAPFDKDDLLKLANVTKAKVIIANEGNDPLVKGNPGYYVPNEWPPHYAVAKTAANVVRHPSDENLQTFWAALKAHDNNDVEAARAIQSELKGEADIALNKRKVAPENVEDVEGAVPIQGERRVFEARTDANVSEVERAQHKDLTDFLNKLSDTQYAKLVDHDPSIHETVDATQDPRAVRLHYQDMLKTLERKRPVTAAVTEAPRVLEDLKARPGELEIPAEDAEAGVTRKVEKAADLPNTGRQIDPNSPEGKKIAAAALARSTKSKAEQLENNDAKIKAAIEAEDPSLFEKALAAARGLVKDESGSVPAVKKDWDAEAEAAKLIKHYKGDLFTALKGVDSHPWWTREDGIRRAAALKNAVIEAVPESERARVRKIEDDFQKENGQRYSDYYAGMFGSKQSHPMGLSDWAEWFAKQKTNVQSFLSDESGALNLQRIKDRLHSLWDPIQPSALDEYADLLNSKDFVKMRNHMTQWKVEAQKVATDAAKAGLSKTDWGNLYRDIEKGKVVQGHPFKDVYDAHVKPMLDQHAQLYDEYRDLMLKHKLPGWDKLPERSTVESNWKEAIANKSPGWQGFETRLKAGEKFNDWFPRVKEGQLWEDLGALDVLAPKRGETLNPFAEGAQPRSWFSMQAANGQRKTYYVPEDYSSHGRLFAFNAQGNPYMVAKVNKQGFDPTRPGDTIEIKGKGGRQNWTVDHAGIDEIHQASSGTETYHDNPMVSLINQTFGLHNAYQRVKMYDAIKENPVFQANTTKDARDDRVKKDPQNIWEKSKLPDFADTYMPKQLRWVLDSFHAPGLNTDDYAIAQKTRNLAAWGTKAFYVLGFPIHDINEFDKWAIGRGWSWLNPPAYKRLVQTGAQAIKSVNTQNHIQKEMVDAGVNPMYAHTMTTRFMTGIAQQMGVDIKRNGSQWDPIFRTLGITSKEGLQAIEKWANGHMWKFSDYMLTQRYLEQKALGKSPEEAAKATHAFIDSYVIPTTVGGKGDWGRFAQKWLTDPMTSLFGRYNYGTFQNWANIIKNGVQKNKTKEQRIEAAGHLMMAGAMAFLFYPAASKMYSMVTGDPHSELETRGMTRFGQGVAQFVGGGEKGDIGNAVRKAWTPSVPLDTAFRLYQGKTFDNTDIVQKDATLPKKALQVGDFVAGQALSPLKPAFNEAMKGSDGHPFRKLLESQVGLKTPSEKEVKYHGQADKRYAREQKARIKKPGGLMEYLYNKAKY